MKTELKKFRLLIQLLLGLAVCAMTVSLWWTAVGHRPEAVRWIPLGCVLAAAVLYATPRGREVWANEKAECRNIPKARVYLWGGIFVLLLLLWGGAWYYAANVRPKVFTVRAKKLISEGKLEQAYPLLRNALNGGDPEILYYYCVPFVSQEDDQMLFATGFEMMIESAEQGFPKAQVLVGEIFRDGRGGIQQNKTEALRYFHLAAAQNDVDGLCQLGVMIHTGDGMERNLQEGFQYLLAAADQNQPEAQFRVGLAYDKGRGVEKDQYKAVEYLQRGADNGNAEAMHLLGLSYLGGHGVERDSVQGRYWINRAAEKGLEPAQELLKTMPL